MPPRKQTKSVPNLQASPQKSKAPQTPKTPIAKKSRRSSRLLAANKSESSSGADDLVEVIKVEEAGSIDHEEKFHLQEKRKEEARRNQSGYLIAFTTYFLLILFYAIFLISWPFFILHSAEMIPTRPIRTDAILAIIHGLGILEGFMCLIFGGSWNLEEWGQLELIVSIFRAFIFISIGAYLPGPKIPDIPTFMILQIVWSGDTILRSLYKMVRFAGMKTRAMEIIRTNAFRLTLLFESILGFILTYQATLYYLQSQVSYHKQLAALSGILVCLFFPMYEILSTKSRCIVPKNK